MGEINKNWVKCMTTGGKYRSQGSVKHSQALRGNLVGGSIETFATAIIAKPRH